MKDDWNLRAWLVKPDKSQTAGYAKKIEQLIKERDELRQSLENHKLAEAFAEDFPNTWGKKKYTAPLKREWVSLTDEEVKQVYQTTIEHVTVSESVMFRAHAKAIEAKLKEKNT